MDSSCGSCTMRMPFRIKTSNFHAVFCQQTLTDGHRSTVGAGFELLTFTYGVHYIEYAYLGLPVRGMASSASRPRKRVYCPHCCEYISRSLFYQHRQLYFDQSKNHWKRSENLRPNSEIRHYHDYSDVCFEFSPDRQDSFANRSFTG